MVRKLQGPTLYSNWLIKNMLMVGAYPGSSFTAMQAGNVLALMDQGISTFVCLQWELDPMERDWKRKNKIRPYHTQITRLVRCVSVCWFTRIYAKISLILRKS